MSDIKHLAFWQMIVEFPFSNVDLLYLDQVLKFFQEEAGPTLATEIWANSMRDKLRVHFNSQGLHEVPDCLDIYEKDA